MTSALDQVAGMIDGLSKEVLEAWIVRGWIRPDVVEGGFFFCPIDIARVRLIAECRFQLDIEDENMDVVLSLLDQVYGLRRELTALARAIDAQPVDIRNDILCAATAGLDDPEI